MTVGRALLKIAFGQAPGTMEKYMPWYTAAAGGTGGAALGAKLMPQKYKMLGSIGGALVGTGIGVHGGEAVGRRIDNRGLAKQAEEEPKKKPSLARVALTGAAGAGLGTIGGYALGHGLERLTGGKIPTSAIQKVAPVLGAGMGVAHGLWQRAENKQHGRR